MKRRPFLEVRVEMNLDKEEDGTFVVTCPQLGCIFVQEESEEAAYRYGREAIDAFFLTALEHGDPIPDEVVVHKSAIDENSTGTFSRARPLASDSQVLQLTSHYDYAA